VKSISIDAEKIGLEVVFKNNISIWQSYLTSH